MNNIHSNTTFLNEAIDKKTDVEDEKTDLILANMIDLRKTMSDVLSLLLGAKENSVIDQALFRILQFFDVDRVYIGTFDEQTHTVDFTNEVTCDGIISMREDLLRQLPQDEIPWWYDSIKKGMDIVIPVSYTHLDVYKRQRIRRCAWFATLPPIPYKRCFPPHRS